MLIMVHRQYANEQAVAVLIPVSNHNWQQQQKAPYGWNQALKAKRMHIKFLLLMKQKQNHCVKPVLVQCLSHVKDGIARGTGAVVTLANEKENLVIIKEKASAHYSFNKGTSTQSYPSSMMGMIALLRQTYLDAQWYKTKPAKEGLNLSLKAWNENQDLPQIFEANDKWNDLRADRIGDEFGVQYIIKGGGNEYQRIKEMKATNAHLFFHSIIRRHRMWKIPTMHGLFHLSDMKHWELAPTNAGAFEKAGIPFCLTTADLRM